MESVDDGRLIAVCVPTLDQVLSSFMHDLCLAVAYHVATHPKDAIQLQTAQGTVLAKTRLDLARDAVESGADWVVWFDSDMRFPKDVIARLLETGAPVVTTNCSKRKEPLGTTAQAFVDPDVPDDEKKIAPIDYSEPRTDLVEIVSGGFAVAAVDTDVYRRMEMPWYDSPWFDDRQIHIGEDIFFCKKLRDIGVPIVCDLELSEEIGHTGLKDYYLKDAREWLSQTTES